MLCELCCDMLPTTEAHSRWGRGNNMWKLEKSGISVKLMSNLIDQELKNRIAILETELHHEKNRGQVSKHHIIYSIDNYNIIDISSISSVINVKNINNNIWISLIYLWYDRPYLQYWCCLQVDLSSLDSKLQGEYEARLKAEVVYLNQTQIKIRICI